MLMFSFSCGDSFLDVNTNPNSAVSSTPELTLTAALAGTVNTNRLSANEIGAMWSGQWSPSGSVSGFTQEKTYDIQTNFRTTIWTEPYNNLQDYKYAEQAALAVGKKAIAGICRVMKAYNYQLIVDAYGNAPYSDALKGTASIRPAYDDASAIYDSLIRDINLGIEYLGAPISSDNPSPGASDIYYGGDADLWIKFANTLKLRILIRESGVTGKASIISTEMAKLAGSHEKFISEDEDVRANPGYLKTSGKQNPWYENYGYSSADTRSGSHDFYGYSDFFVKFLSDTRDSARIKLLTYPVIVAGDTSIVGVPFGEGNDTYLYSKISGYGPALLPNDASVKASTLYQRDQIVMSAAESFFLQAEAVQRGLLTSDLSAQALYEAGVAQSFALLSSMADYTALASAWKSLDVDTELDLYLNSGLNNVDWTSSASKLDAIRTQKWIALAGIGGFEAWTEYRRTGVPIIPLSTRAIGAQQPVRLLYPLSEYSNNADNTNKQGTINQFTSKIFWDVN